MASISVDDIKSLRAPGKLAPTDYKVICLALDVLQPAEKLLPNMDLYAARIAEHAPKATAEQLAAIQTQLGPQKWDMAKIFFEKGKKTTTAIVATSAVKPVVPKANPTVKPVTAVTAPKTTESAQPEGLELKIHRLETLLTDVKDLLVSLHEKQNVTADGLASMDKRIEDISDAVADMHKITAYTLKQNFDAPVQAVLDAGEEVFEYQAPAVAFARGTDDEEAVEPEGAAGE